MFLKMHQIIDFPIFFEKVQNQKLTFKLSYRLAMLASEMQKHIEYYQGQFRNLILQYSEKDEQNTPVLTEDGSGFKLAQETMEEAYQKFNELHDLDVEVPDNKFSIDDFSNIELTPSEIKIILPFIAE